MYRIMATDDYQTNTNHDLYTHGIRELVRAS